MLPKYTVKYNKEKIRKALEEAYDRRKQVVIMRMQRAGERFITNARENGSYNDITGNLRNSVGYLILDIGKVVAESFFGSEGDGPKKAKAFLESIKGEYPDGLVMIACAGMEYAAAVESRGKDVITSSVPELRDDLRKAFAALNKKKVNLLL